MSWSPESANVEGVFLFGPSDRMLRFVLLVAGIAVLPGCDPVRTIRHSVRIAVTDENGLPAPNLRVSMKESWESWRLWVPATTKTEMEYHRARWHNDIRWLDGVTDAQGKSAIEIERTGLDHTRGNEPPASSDVVSNREYMIRLEGCDAQDEMRVVMKVGARATGSRYTIEIEGIDKPTYADVIAP